MISVGLTRLSQHLRTTLIKIITRSCSIRCGPQCATSVSAPSFNPILFNVGFKQPLKNISVQLPAVGVRIMQQPTEPTIIQLPLLDPILDKSDTNTDPAVDQISNGDNAKHCARLITIRRRKMRRHKLRKLRKKLMHIRMKIHLKREKFKQAKFEAEIWGKINMAQAFNAEEWVTEVVRKAFTDPKTLREKREKKTRPIKYVFPAPTKRR